MEGCPVRLGLLVGRTRRRAAMTGPGKAPERRSGSAQTFRSTSSCTTSAWRPIAAIPAYLTHAEKLSFGHQGFQGRFARQSQLFMHS